MGSDHHIKGNLIETEATKRVIKGGKSDFYIDKGRCKLQLSKLPAKFAIISPLKEDAEVSGTLKDSLLQGKMQSRSKNINLAAGLSSAHINPYFEISRLGELKTWPTRLKSVLYRLR